MNTAQIVPCLIHDVIITSPAEAVVKYCDEYVCVSVCKDISGTTCVIFTNFCACCLWPGLDLPPAG